MEPTVWVKHYDQDRLSPVDGIAGRWKRYIDAHETGERLISGIGRLDPGSENNSPHRSLHLMLDISSSHIGSVCPLFSSILLCSAHIITSFRAKEAVASLKTPDFYNLATFVPAHRTFFHFLNKNAVH